MDENLPQNSESPVTPPVAPAAPATPPPPPIAPPPIITPPPAAPPPRKSRGWMIIALLAIVFLVVSLMFNVGHLLHGFGSLATKGKMSHGEGHFYEERTIEDNDSDNKVAVVEVQGIITGQMMEGGQNMVTMIKDQLKMAGDDKNVKAVILKVDSPGGEVLASDDIARAITDFHQKSKKPVIAAMQGMAASGGYYVSAPCQWIVANELTITGSIGVIMESYNYRGLLNKVGVQPMVFKSGKFKDMLSGEKLPEEISPEEKQMVQALIDETYGKFKQVVSDGRQKAESGNKSRSDKGRPLDDKWRDYADGRILSGKQAFDLGFVDEIGTFDDAVARARKMAGINDANVIHYQQPFDLSNLLHLFGKSEAHTVKVDLGMDLPRLQVGRPYFLSSSVLH